MNQVLIGRQKEQDILHTALLSNTPEMVAIIGRYRVGKTFLVRCAYAQNIVFEITGIQNATQKEQLQNFTYQLQVSAGKAYKFKKPSNWLSAFQILSDYLNTLPSTLKPVLFFDELPWLSSPKSGFLNALGFFWNSWASQRNIVVVLCGSAASWMIQKVVQHKGGLHNRITKRINLLPFNLNETEFYLKNRQINLDRYQILQIYMALGGVPHYLNEVKGGQSATQNIEQICFSKDGLLFDEFTRLYPALFENAENHIAIIRALAQKQRGLTRKELVETSKLPDGGNTSRYIEELISSGFVSSYYPFGKSNKDTLYRLTDEYSLFYLQFIENRRHEGGSIWQHLSQTPLYVSWSGYAFEGICLKHLPQIKQALGISGVYTESSGFVYRPKGDEAGIQIDLLIDRRDQVINLFEIKFHSSIFTVTKAHAAKLRNKVGTFRQVTGTNKQVFLNLITTFGLQPNEHSIGLIDADMTIDVLFV